MIYLICREQNISLYEPRTKSDPVHHADLDDASVFRMDRERVNSSDLLIHLCHFPSTGSGQELDFAHTALLPIVLIRHAERKASRMITGIPSIKVEIAYTDPEQLESELRERLSELRPVLEERKLSLASCDANIVGSRVRELRSALSINRADLATVTGYEVDGIRQLEDSPDRVSNPSLIQLRRLAAALKTTVADLVAPELSSVLISQLIHVMDADRPAARYEGISRKDQYKLLRRVLLRVLDQLEKEG